jgi:hypothetical protein
VLKFRSAFEFIIKTKVAEPSKTKVLSWLNISDLLVGSEDDYNSDSFIGTYTVFPQMSAI